MRYKKINRVIALVVMLIVAGVAPAARANINYSAQDLPTPTCDNIGVLSPVTYIRRVNTKGGLTPTAAGATISALADVPYTADHYFYRATN
jgi:hypothetical protein